MNRHELLAYLKKDWQRAAVITGALLVCISVLIIGALVVAHRTTVSRERPANVNETPPTPAVTAFADLYAVVIDNHADSRPPSGIEAASIVYEAPAEGGITRLLAVFGRGADIAEIGPVRSARTYFLDWAGELGPALFLHFGGSPESLARIKSTPSLRDSDADGMGNAGGTFWRDERRRMPHNAYTASSDVEKLFATRGGAERKVTTWLAGPDPALDARGEGKGVTIPFFGTAYAPEWRYERDRNIYVRYDRGATQKTRDGNRIEAKNVVVMYTDISTIDDIGRKRIRTTGEGTGLVLRNGDAFAVTWKNEAGGPPALFYDGQGSEVVFAEGAVWIEVVPKQIQVEVKESG